MWVFALQPWSWSGRLTNQHMNSVCGISVIYTDRATNYRYLTNFTWAQPLGECCPATTETPLLWALSSWVYVLPPSTQDSGNEEAYMPGNHIGGYDPFVLPPHELNHREDTSPTTTWTQSRGCLVVEKSHQSTRAFLLTTHKSNHNEDIQPITTWTQSVGGELA